MGSSKSLHTREYRLVRRVLLGMREGAGLSQRALGEKLGRPYSFVYKCEAGERRIDPLELILWCRACDCNPAQVVKDLEKQFGRT